MADVEVTREHREAAMRMVQPVYQNEDSELREWVTTGYEEAGKWWICDCTIAHAAEQVAAAELRGKRAILREIREEAKFHSAPTPCTADEIALAFDLTWDKYQPKEPT